jgi:hypothetical protein
MKHLLLIIAAAITFYSCNTENPVTNTSDGVVYYKVSTQESGSVKFEVWSATGQNLYYGYNDIGFKVFVNGTEKTDGFVKFKPLMIHFPGQTGHSCPRSDYFYYDNTKSLFRGYVCFSMISDSSGEWTGYYNYNNQSFVDSLPFMVQYSAAQLLGWDDVLGGNSYVLTLIKPNNPALGLNDFECMLHKDIGNNDFAEVDSAQMIIKPWMVTHGHGSSNNTNPVLIGGGRYKGKTNFTMPGGWLVYDTIRVNNVLVTKNNPPSFRFEVQ